jgi:hypothetical protein
MNDKSQPEQVKAVFRDGSVTVVGVIVGLSLTYPTSWASNPVPWQLHDPIGTMPLVIGVVFQLFGLSPLLHTNSLERPVYDRALRFFLIGLIRACTGLVGMVAVDSVLSARRS